jgi:CzcA family heavy metal efflux pump
MKNYFSSYKNPITACLLIILLGGIFVFSQFKTALFPEITFPKIKVIADAGLQPVDKMMVTVTKPLESAIKQVPDLLNIRSITSRGTCEISAFMDWNSNIDLSKQRIESKIAEVSNSLPAGVQITVEKMNPSILQVIGYSLEANSQHSLIEMKTLALFTIKPFLSQVPGVSEVRITGGRTKEYWIRLNISKMSSLGITPDAISTALAQTNFIKSNGYLQDYHMLYLTVTDAMVHNLDQLKSVVISNNGKRIIRLNDFAEISVNEATEFTRINANGRESILVAIIKQPNSNLIDLSSAMEDKVSELQKILPAGMVLKPYYVQADFVQDAVKSVIESVWIGLMLAIVVSVIFLRSLKASATILITIPITVCLTLIWLYQLGYTLNIMTLGAIAASIGLIIDDAIVVVEQIQRTHEEHPGEYPGPLVIRAIRYLFPAMVGSSISTIVIFIPFEWMSGVAGSYFKVLTNTMIITLISSFFVTWIGLPVIYLLLSRKKPRIAKTEKIPVSQKGNQKWIGLLIHRPFISFLLVAGMIVSAVIILPRLETGFLPEMDEGSIVLDYASPPGTSLNETDRMLREAEKLIVQVPEVSGYSRRTGTQLGFFITEPNTGDYLIQLKKDRHRTTDEVIADIRKQIESTQPALRIDFGQVIGDMLGDLMTSVQPISIKIFGNDATELKKLSAELAAVIGKVEGTADVFDGVVIAGPSVNIRPDYDKLSQFGITPASFQYQVQTNQEGNTVGTILEKEQTPVIRIIDSGYKNHAIDQLGLLPIFLPSGKLKLINELATIEVNPGDAEIKRENLQAMGEVTARLENRDLGSVMTEIKQKIASGISLPLGYHIEYGGAYAEQQQSFKELFLILLASTLLVFAVILFLFRDFRVSLLIILLAVLGISGSCLALYLTGTPLNVGSYTGIIMIVGIIGENAIFTFLQFRDSLHERSVDDSVVFAISTRLRPKLMTALGAIIALMPLALGIGTGAQLHQPLAIAVIGGFVFALPILLIILPAMLRILFKNRTGQTTEFQQI